MARNLLPNEVETATKAELLDYLKPRGFKTSGKSRAALVELALAETERQWQTGIDRARALMNEAKLTVERDLPIPERGYTQGWDVNMARSPGSAVFPAWSESNLHGEGDYKFTRKYASQCGLALFSTRERAVRAYLQLLAGRFVLDMRAIQGD